ncbi:E3 ubiquitin-protein ligase synoviolin-like [Oscarella lobularis]|uniref:E3 ubiquitin-protein ligase synoviolin-like n=1 Tax=Oscarella lobularis TaxID=121494 RepID=UPI0033137BF6
MKTVALTLASVAATSSVVGYAFYKKHQFYPTVVYLTKSSPSLAVLYIQAFVLVILLSKLVRKIFFGRLRAAETEHLIERSWYAVTETCLAFTVFREDFSPWFVAMFTMLLVMKSFHWLAEDRIDYMERSPVITWLFHIRAIAMVLVLGTINALFIHHAYRKLLMNVVSVHIVFGFEYAILLVSIVNRFTKYLLHSIDIQSANPWENKSIYMLYTDFFLGALRMFLYSAFMFIMIKVHTFPLFSIRPMYLALRQFKKSFSDIVLSRRAISNMNSLYPNATDEELAQGNNTCIICRDTMTSQGSKKLPCSHIFHINCLRSWFQRQQTCPTCRMDILRSTTPAHIARMMEERIRQARQNQRPPPPPPPQQQQQQQRVEHPIPQQQQPQPPPVLPADPQAPAFAPPPQPQPQPPPLFQAPVPPPRLGDNDAENITVPSSSASPPLPPHPPPPFGFPPPPPFLFPFSSFPNAGAPFSFPPPPPPPPPHPPRVSHRRAIETTRRSRERKRRSSHHPTTKRSLAPRSYTAIAAVQPSGCCQHEHLSQYVWVF